MADAQTLARATDALRKADPEAAEILVREICSLQVRSEGVARDRNAAHARGQRVEQRCRTLLAALEALPLPERLGEDRDPPDDSHGEIHARFGLLAEVTTAAAALKNEISRP